MQIPRMAQPERVKTVHIVTNTTDAELIKISPFVLDGDDPKDYQIQLILLWFETPQDLFWFLRVNHYLLIEHFPKIAFGKQSLVLETESCSMQYGFDGGLSL